MTWGLIKSPEEGRLVCPKYQETSSRSSLSCFVIYVYAFDSYSLIEFEYTQCSPRGIYPVEHPPSVSRASAHITTHLTENCRSPTPRLLFLPFRQKNSVLGYSKVQSNINKKTNILSDISSIVPGKLDYSFDWHERKAELNVRTKSMHSCTHHCTLVDVEWAN